jgi:5'-3' exonuclease
MLFQIPEFDNLYLDMNGIIHMCSHPNDFDPHFRITEEKIFKDIFHYIEVSFETEIVHDLIQTFQSKCDSLFIL